MREFSDVRKVLKINLRLKQNFYTMADSLAGMDDSWRKNQRNKEPINKALSIIKPKKQSDFT